MKLFCRQSDLENALNIVNKAITPNATLPVLNNILLKAEDKKLFFSATNLEIAIQFFIDADVKNEGSVTVPAKLITSYISLLKDEKIEVSLKEGNMLFFESKSSQTKVKGISADEFPTIPKVPKENTIKVKTKDLEEAITQTVFSASINTSRPVLSGILFHIEKDLLKIVATDSYRLAEKQLALLEKTEVSLQSIIPARTVAELGKILARTQEKEVEISISNNQALFVIGDIELMSRLIEGKFPDYEKIIPKSNKTNVEVKNEDLSLVVKRVSLFAKENNNSVKLAATNDGKIVISTEETKVGEEKAEVAAKVEGENSKVALNIQYLLDVLNFVQSDQVVLSMDDKLSPVVIRPAGKKDYIYIIMPLKI
jgi:DNA polymerase-3 subunit beta